MLDAAITLSIFAEQVPFFDCTVKTFIIGFLALLAAVWLGFYIFGKAKANFS